MLTITQLTFGEYHNAVTCKVDALDMETQEPAEEVIEYPQITSVLMSLTDYRYRVDIQLETGVKFLINEDVPMKDTAKMLQEYCAYLETSKTKY